MDRRRQVPERDQRLSSRVIDADQDGEKIQDIDIEQRRPEIVGDKRDHRREEGSVEGQLLRLAPPGALPPLTLDERGGHPRLGDGQHNGRHANGYGDGDRGDDLLCAGGGLGRCRGGRCW